jgi:hypothetical protein
MISAKSCSVVGGEVARNTLNNTCTWQPSGLFSFSYHGSLAWLHGRLQQASDTCIAVDIFEISSNLETFFEERYLIKMRRRRSAVVLQHANSVRVVILGKKGVGKSGNTIFSLLHIDSQFLTYFCRRDWCVHPLSLIRLYCNQ